MMEHGVQPDGLIGVSAGAAFGCNYKSRQEAHCPSCLSQPTAIEAANGTHSYY